MFYAWDIEVLSGTEKTEPTLATLKMSYGIIRDVTIKFPAGCHTLVGIKLLRFMSQIIPLNLGDWLTGNKEPVVCEVYYPLLNKPYELKFRGSAPSTDYDHTITVRANVLPPHVLFPNMVLPPVDEEVEEVYPFFEP